MRRLLFVLSLVFVHNVCSQTTNAFNSNDDKYLEDQFYLGITYNFLLDKPADVTQRNLSYGLQGGFIKDIPLNSNRTFGLGIGMGLAVNSYYSNMLASETNTGIAYTVVGEDIDLKRSKIETHLIELPFEFRWRNSTSEEYRFWRVYSGVKFGYAFGSRSKSITETNDKRNKTTFNNPDLRKLQYGLMFNFGYHTFNVHVYYSLNSLLEDSAVIEGEEINMKPLRIGLIFYIL